MIYFIQDESALFIKIGYTAADDAMERLRDLQTGCPSGLVLLYSMPGSMDYERELHQRFSHARVRGEWFQPVPDLLRFILGHAASAAVVSATVSGTQEPERLLAFLEQAAFLVSLAPDAQTLLVSPKSRLTEAMKQNITAHKPALVELLKTRQVSL